MKEPRRLLADSATSELSRSLLAAGRARREPEGARERVWGAVAVGIAGGAATSAAAGAGAGAGAGVGAGAGAGAGANGAGVALTLTKVKLLVAGGLIATAASVAVVTEEAGGAGRDWAVSVVVAPAPSAPAAPAQANEWCAPGTGAGTRCGT